jgi:pimeloyl-ACP methyl ester carboxylesterase
MMFVYLHGFASGPGSTKAARFSALFRDAGIQLLIPDLSAGNFENLTLTGQLGVLQRTIEASPARLIGSSLGGYLAALFAAGHPQVDRVVLLAPAFGFRQLWPRTLGAERFAEWKRTGYLETYHYGEQRMRRVSYRLCEDAEQYPVFPHVTQAALVFHGSKDEVIPPAYSHQFADGRPNVQLRILDSGHELLEGLEEICREAFEFLT